MVMKFRMVKFARIPSYNQLFSGDPVWATLEVGGHGQDGRSMVTKNDFRFLHTLEEHGTFTRTKPYSILFFKTSRELQEVCSSYFCRQQAQSSMRTMMLCVRYGAMITASAAVYLLQRQVRKCSSSELVQTLLNVFFTLSTVVLMKKKQVGPAYSQLLLSILTMMK